jgi:tetratricopeptide (TPR) repeat protein
MADIKAANAFTFPAVDKANHRYQLTVKGFNNRAVACRRQNDFKYTIKNYNAALSIDRGFAILYNNRGVACLKKKAFDRAISDFNRALEIAPGSGIAYYNRGIAWRAKKIWIVP